MSVEYRVVCALRAKDPDVRDVHRLHVWHESTHEDAVDLAARLDELLERETCQGGFEVQARYVGAWDRIDVTEELASRIEALRDGGPAPPVAGPPNTSPPSRTPETATP